TEATDLLAKIRADFDGMAEEAFKKAAEKARALAEEKKPDEAKKALADVEERFGASEWFTSRGKDAIAGELGKVEEERGKVPNSALARAQEALDAREFDKAREALEDRAAWPQDFRERADELLKTIDETAAKLALEAKRKKAWTGFLLGFADAGRKNLAEAKGYLEREGRALVQLGPTGEIEKKLALLERHFREVRLVEDLAEVGFRGARGTIYITWKGERVAGKTTGVEKGVVRLTTTRGKRASIPVCEVAGPDVVRLAKLMRPESGQRLTAATYLLLRGEPEAAREAAKEATGDAAWALGDEIDEFTSAVSARLKREEAAKAAAKVAEAAKAAKATTKAKTDAEAEKEAEKEDKKKVLEESLVSHWKLDDGDGTTVKDSADNGNDGTIRGEVKWTDGRSGGSLEFDGKKTKVEIANESTYDFTKSMTVAAWIKVSGWATDWQPIIAKGNTAWRLQRAARLDSLIFVCNYPRIKVIGSVDVNDGMWHHVAGTFDGTTMSLYVDGVLDNSARAKGRIATNMSRVAIGHNSALGRYWKGRIDDVRIHNIALPAEAICELAGGVDAFLVAHWKFDAEEHPQPDASGRGHDATVNGATWTAQGRLGGALEFDGEGGHVALPEGFANFTRGITVALWAYPTSNGNHARFIDFGNGPGKDNIIFMREKRTPGLDFHCYKGKRQLKSVLA
ncbi:MAG: LamG domain-containing protein, partial [Planctomycetota bacterium]